MEDVFSILHAVQCSFVRLTILTTLETAVSYALACGNASGVTRAGGGARSHFLAARTLLDQSGVMTTVGWKIRFNAPRQPPRHSGLQTRATVNEIEAERSEISETSANKINAVAFPKTRLFDLGHLA